MRVGLVGAATGASVGASVGAAVAGASVTMGASVTGAAVGVAAEPQAVNTMEKTSNRARAMFRELSFILLSFIVKIFVNSGGCPTRLTRRANHRSFQREYDLQTDKELQNGMSQTGTQ